MTPRADQPKKIVFLFSDTGGGHRSASEAIIEALDLEYPGLFHTQMVDIFRDYAPFPYKHTPEMYPQMTRNPRLWEAGYRMSNGKRKADMFTQFLWPYVRQAMQRLVRENPCDLFVSVHPFANRALLNVTQYHKTPLITVVTDMVSVHAFWFDPRTDLVIVPTEAARQHGIENGVSPDKIIVAGQPVADRFCHPLGDKAVLKQQLGWTSGRPVVLLVGGGQGLGPLRDIAFAIDQARLPLELVIIAGRNQRLVETFEEHAWQIPTHVYGFVKDMPDFMTAADILLTKAGPGTISEAFIVGLPLILYSRLPGQEDGNVSYVLEHHAGVWAPETHQVIGTLQGWLDNPGQLAQAAAASQKLGKPEATRHIARLIADRIIYPIERQFDILYDHG